MTAIDICVPRSGRSQWLGPLVIKGRPPSWICKAMKARDRNSLPTETADVEKCSQEFLLLLDSSEGTFKNPDVRRIDDLDKEDYDSIFDTSEPWGAKGFGHEMTE